jgi:hypothetical protein
MMRMAPPAPGNGLLRDCDLALLDEKRGEAQHYVGCHVAKITQRAGRHPAREGGSRHVKNMALPDPVAILVSILFMAATIIASARLVLRIRPLPYGPALLIAAVANLLGKLFVSVLHWPGVVSYSLPTIAFLGLSYVFFKPSVSKLFFYWILGFALYLVVHLLITRLFGWTFMFPFWAPRVLG